MQFNELLKTQMMLQLPSTKNPLMNMLALNGFELAVKTFPTWSSWASAFCCTRRKPGTSVEVPHSALRTPRASITCERGTQSQTNANRPATATMFSGRMDAAIGSANANHMTAEMGRAGIESARSNHLVPYDIRGEGLYSGRSVMFGRGHREHASVAVGGNLLGGKRELPPALQSQPYAANFQFQFTLPPNFQRFSGGK